MNPEDLTFDPYALDIQRTMPNLALVQDLIVRLPWTHRDDDDDDFIFRCLICGTKAHIAMTAGPGGDSIWCMGACEDAAVRAAVTYYVREVPEACPNIRYKDRSHQARSCAYCQHYELAIRRAVEAIDRGDPEVFDTVDEADDGWPFVSLVDAEPTPPPTLLHLEGNDDGALVRAGWLTLVHGRKGSGKTPLCYLAVVQAVQAGHLAMIIDYEMGRSGAVDLLRDLGLSEDEIGRYVLYADGLPPLTSTEKARLVQTVSARSEAAGGRTLAVAVIDSLTESMAAMMPGASDNDAQDVTTWVASLPKWIRDQFGAGVLVIDHSGNADGPRPAGSHKKSEVAQAHFWVQPKKPFSKAHEEGRSTITVVKDRSGESRINSVIAVLRNRLGAGFHLEAPAPMVSTDGSVISTEFEAPEGCTAEEVLADIQNAGPGGIAKTMLCGQGTRGQFRRSALTTLLSEGRAVERKAGRRVMVFTS